MSGESIVKVGQADVRVKAVNSWEGHTVTIKAKVMTSQRQEWKTTRSLMLMRSKWQCELVLMFLQLKCMKNAGREEPNAVRAVPGWVVPQESCALSQWMVTLSMAMRCKIAKKKTLLTAWRNWHEQKLLERHVNPGPRSAEKHGELSL